MIKTTVRLVLGVFLMALVMPVLPGGQATADSILARLTTNRGVIVLELDYGRAPLTVANFIGLAEGTIPNGVLPAGRPFFNGTKFHRVVPGHVIQAGRPDREGVEGPNYEFPNEIVPGLGHDRAGILGMANSGPHTNGSQFYITLAERSYLDGDYTVFGRVVEGLDVVMSIVQGDVVSSVEVVRTGPGAQAFKSDSAGFLGMLAAARQRVLEEAKLKDKTEAGVIAANWPEAKPTPGGLKVQVLRPGRAALPDKDDRLRVVYSGLTLAGKRFYSTSDAGRPAAAPPAEPFLFAPGQTTITPALSAALAEMAVGEKRLVVAPAAQAYGNRGFYARERQGQKRFVISPGTTLVYEVELLEARKPDYPVRPVPFTQVEFTDRFWAPRLETNRRVTIPYALEQCAETGRIKNFETAAAVLAGAAAERVFHSRYPFDDSDVYKVIEGASYSLKTHPDPKLDGDLDALIAKIAAAQEKDGYLYTARTIFPQNPPTLWVDSPGRWSNLRWGHELYNAGHLYEAAAAHFQATGKRSLLEVALKNADLVASVFGPGGRRGLPGHPEIELGLVKLYRLTGARKYLDLAAAFIAERGRAAGRESFGEYAQDHLPLAEQSEPVGHAVRAAYLYSGAADLAALTSAGQSYRSALETLWRNAVTRKMYLTGGIGAVGAIEGFGPDYLLPNASAYCETCASIALALWSQRMFLLTGESGYLDVLERLLYNGILSGVSLGGDLFFYPNPLASFGQHQRSPWFACACCPTNVSRFIPSIPGAVYAVQDSTLYVNLYADSRATVVMDDGLSVQVSQRTDYPCAGKVSVFIDPKAGRTFTVALRLPGWARNKPVPGDLYTFAEAAQAAPVLKVNGQPAEIDPEKGWAMVKRTWAKGDWIELELPMAVRRVKAHERVKDDAGRLAVERGPLVYCAEGVDNAGHVANLVLPAGAPLSPKKRDDLLGGLVVLEGSAVALQRGRDGKSVQEKSQPFTAIPYYAWAHRGRTEMAVWLPVAATGARALPRPTRASSAEATASSDKEAWAVNDQWDPASSDDTTYPVLHWRPNKGTREFVQYTFGAPTRVSGAEVFWYEDPEGGECRVPESWRVLYLDGTIWKAVSDFTPATMERDRYNVMTFSPVQTTGLRLELKCQKGYSAGIHEWKLR